MTSVIAAARAERRSLNLLAFAALCFAATFVWDVAYASLYDHGGEKVLGIIPGAVWFFVLPVALNAALGFATGQGRSGRAILAAIGCLGVPLFAFIPFARFMCAAFNSCFGD
jgi:hypothetical protein